MKCLMKLPNQTKKVNLDDLIYRYKGNICNEEFNTYDNTLDHIDEIKNGEIKVAEVKNNQNNFKLNLGEIKKGGKKSKEQKNTIYNIEMIYKARKETINFFDDCSLMVSEAKNKAKNGKSGKGLKILTPKQSDRLFTHYIEQKKLLKKYTIT